MPCGPSFQGCHIPQFYGFTRIPEVDIVEKLAVTCNAAHIIHYIQAVLGDTDWFLVLSSIKMIQSNHRVKRL